MAMLRLYDEHRYSVFETEDDDENDYVAFIPPADGLPDEVHMIDIVRIGADEPSNFSYETLKSLIDKVPRKLAEVDISSEEDEPSLSPEYLGLLVSICNKAEKITFDFYNGLSHPAEIDCLATCLMHRDGVKELDLDFSHFGENSSNVPHLRQLFRSIAASPSLEKVKFHFAGLNDEVDGSDESLGDVLVKALKSTLSASSLKTLEIEADWGMPIERICCAFIDHTRVENLILFSSCPEHFPNTKKARSFKEQVTTRRFFEALASAKNLKNLDLYRSCLPISDDAYLNSLEDAVSRNRCMERFILRHYNGEGEREVDWHRRHEAKIYIPHCVNRAAWGLNHSIPSGLWPHVLERAGNILYYAVERRESSGKLVEDEWKSPSSELPRADVVYKLLRERVLVG